jgi:MFS transporter, FSR family, fosmidomycin resistance protein
LNEKNETPNKIEYRGLILLSLGHLVADLNQGILPTIMPFLKESLDFSYAMVGTIILFSNLTSSVVQPIFGYLSDRKSLPGFLPLGCFMAALGMAFIGFAGSYWQVLLLVVLSGLGVAIYHPQGWRNANFFAGEKKATGMSIFAIGGNLGFALGPLLATILVKNLSLKGSPFFLLPGGIMAGIFALSTFWRVKRTGLGKKVTSASTVEAVRSAIRPLSLLLAMITLRSWAHMGLLIFIPFYYISYMKGDPIHAGQLLFAFLTAGVFGTLLGGPLADRYGHKKIILVSLGLSCPLLVFFLLSSGVWSYFWLFLAGCVLVLSFSVSMVMGQSFMPHHVATASGLMLGLAFGTGGLGAALLGLLADRFGVLLTIWVVAFLPWLSFIFAALIPYPFTRKETTMMAS